MKILIASDLHYPAINGVATFSRNLAIGLADRGNEVQVIAPSPTGKKWKEVDGNHIIVRTVSAPLPFFQNLRISLAPGREVRKAMHEFQPDIVHTQTPGGIGQSVIRYAHKHHIPIVSTNHGMPENILENMKFLMPIAKPISHKMEKFGAKLYSKANFITQPTQSAIDMFNAEKVHVPMMAVSNGIDLKRFNHAPANPETYKKFHIPTGAPVISYIGRLDAEKHISVLVRAFKRVKEEQPNAHLLIVGFGTDVPNLKALTKQLKLTKDVTFTGRVSDDEIVELHKIGTVFCMPSPAELQSIAALEAMASGQPVVAVDAGALRELCQNGRNGYLCEQDNDKEIAAGLLKIIKDPKLREKMSKESLKIAGTHDLQATLDKFEKIYASLIKS